MEFHQADKSVFEKKIPYSTVRKFWINFTCRLVVGSHVEKVAHIKTKSDWLLKFQLKKSAKKVEKISFSQVFLFCFLILHNRV